MVTISELKAIRKMEGKKLQTENSLERQKNRIIQDIKRIRRSRMGDKIERQKKAGAKLQDIKRTGLKVGRKVISFLQDLRDSN